MPGERRGWHGPRVAVIRRPVDGMQVRGSVSRIGESRVFAEASFVVMWSSGFIGAKLGTAEAATPTLMAWRFLLAAGILMAGVLILRRSMPHLKELAVQGVVGFLSQGVYLTGVVGAVEFGVSAGVSALVAALQPMLAAALAGPVLGERVMSRQWIGLFIGLAGVALVVGGDIGSGGDAPIWAYGLPFLGMVGLVSATLVERKNNLRNGGSSMPMDVALAIQCSVSAVLFAALALFWGGLEPAGGIGFWAAVAWVVVFSTFGGYGFYWLNLKSSGVARVSSLIYLTPPATMVWAYLMFGENIRPIAFVGLPICLLGVLLANRDSQPVQA